MENETSSTCSKLAWQGEVEPAANPHFALNLNLAAVKLDEMFDDGQAEAGPFRAIIFVRMRLDELIEDARALLGRNAATCIGDTEAHCCGPGLGGDGDAAFTRGELDGIAEEVG